MAFVVAYLAVAEKASNQVSEPDPYRSRDCTPEQTSQDNRQDDAYHDSYETTCICQSRTAEQYKEDIPSMLTRAVARSKTSVVRPHDDPVLVTVVTVFGARSALARCQVMGDVRCWSSHCSLHCSQVLKLRSVVRSGQGGSPPLI